MVNFDRRVIIEDIVNYWWVNWGYKSSVCDCDVFYNFEFSFLARIIDWYYRFTGLQVEVEVKIKGLVKFGVFEVMLERQRSLKKFKKENDFVQFGQDSVFESLFKLNFKRFKGILKKRSNSEYRFYSIGFIEGVVIFVLFFVFKMEQDLCRIGVFVSSFFEVEVFGKFSFKQLVTMFKKGILKKIQQRESGYYFFLERSEFLELLDSNDGMGSSIFFFSFSDLVRVTFYSFFCRRKGILKYSSKYLVGIMDSVFASFEMFILEFLLEFGVFVEGFFRSYSRFFSVISEDSVLFSDFFDLLDLQENRFVRQRIRSCVFVENFFQIQDFEGFQNRFRFQYLKRYRNRLGDSSFSFFTDMDDVIQVYKKALEICNKFNQFFRGVGRGGGGYEGGRGVVICVNELVIFLLVMIRD